jgi:arylsulfatase A-like enzyme
MADDALHWMNQFNEIDPSMPFLVYYAPGATHAPHHPTPESAQPLRNTGYAHGFQTRSAWQSRHIAETDPAEHLFTWDFETMEKALCAAGFSQVKRQDFNPSLAPRRARMEHSMWIPLAG